MAEEQKVIIEAVINVLNATTLRIDQIETAGRLNACVMKLEEVLKGVTSDETKNQQGENV